MHESLPDQKSPGLAFNPALHGLRCIAAMAVLLFHWGEYFPGGMRWLAKYHIPDHPWVNLSLPFALGSQGVYLFFVLSGYLLASQWQGKVITWVTVIQFYCRRFARIYPAFWLQLFCIIIYAIVVPGVFSLPSEKSLILNAVLWINLPTANAVPMNDVWRTLPVELMFYIILPPVLLMIQKVGLIQVFILSLTLALGWRWAIMLHYDGELLSRHLDVLDALPGVFGIFMAGVGASYMQNTITKRNRNTVLVCSVAFFVLLQAVFIDGIEEYWDGGVLLLMWNTLVGISMALMLSVICSQEAPNWLSGPILVWMGEISFGIYLWHFPFMRIIHFYLPELGMTALNSFFILLVVIALTLLIASASYYFLERPAINMMRKNPKF